MVAKAIARGIVLVLVRDVALIHVGLNVLQLVMILVVATAVMVVMPAVVIRCFLSFFMRL